jgi:hypothetical protein
MLKQGHRMEAEIQLQNVHNLGAGRDGFSAPRLDIFTTSPKKDLVPILQESGRVSGPV